MPKFRPATIRPTSTVQLDQGAGSGIDAPGRGQNSVIRHRVDRGRSSTDVKSVRAYVRSGRSRPQEPESRHQQVRVDEPGQHRVQGQPKTMTVAARAPSGRAQRTSTTKRWRRRRSEHPDEQRGRCRAMPGEASPGGPGNEPRTAPERRAAPVGQANQADVQLCQPHGQSSILRFATRYAMLQPAPPGAAEPILDYCLIGRFEADQEAVEPRNGP